jgi:Na+-driven multidrug efflux pump
MIVSNELGNFCGFLWYFWLGRLVGQNGLVVDSLFSPFSLFVAWCFGSTAAGASVLVSRSVGASDGRGLSIAAASTSLTFVGWAIVAIVLVPVSPWLAGVLAGDLPVDRSMLQFLLGWLLVSLPASSVVNVLFEVANSTGATKFNLVRTVIDLALIAALVPLLIEPAGLGIAGAPIAAGIGAIGLSIAMWVALVRGRSKLALGERGHSTWRTRWTLWKEILAIGVPLQVGRIAMFVAEMILVRLIIRDGEANVAGYGIAGVLLMFAATVTFAIAQAGGILIGQSLGAGLHARARSAIRATLFGACLVMALFIALTVFDRPLIEVFTSERAIADATEQALALMRWGFLGVATWQVLLAVFGAYRATVKAGILAVIGEAFGVVLAFLLPGSRLEAVCTAFIAANALKALLLLSLLARGALREKEVPVATPETK